MESGEPLPECTIYFHCRFHICLSLALHILHRIIKCCSYASQFRAFFFAFYGESDRIEIDFFVDFIITHRNIYLLRFVIPESPRWLLCKGRTAEVAEIVRKVCEVNKRECPPNVEMLLKPPPSNNQTGDDGCISLFGNSYLRLITICFPCIWFTINLVYYGLILNMNTFGGNVYLNTVSFHFLFEFSSNTVCQFGFKTKFQCEILLE